MLNLTLKGVDVFINRLQTKKEEAFWNNYDLVIWKKDNSGYSDIKGVYRNNAWGKAEKISVNSKGVWELPIKYVKHLK